ncbi:major facilitator superfamily domain-containing protein [Aspergillus avenaceus]|uniref:Major facilitator superfamily domain-containing protein n=1 Tax=Aspergillus avenaceus TaxID=36643 RepID=A0A5N6U709_ASPAV|nr:major facilitator superfamily domain-containing protein [Aspergillus avenaceus]
MADLSMKPEEADVTAVDSTSDSEKHDSPDPSISERRLMFKIDSHVLPILCVMYFLAFLDRINMGHALVFGLEDDLGMDSTSNQINVALTIFFVPYVLLEVPSNMVLKKMKPHVWLSGCMFCFGVLTIGQGLVKNYGGLLATRFFIGVAESGMFPGCYYLIGMWYKRPDALRRYTYFFNSTTLAGAFGGLIAYGTGKMQGMRGYGAWRWLFIIEGAVTCFVAILAYFTISDFPEQARWLNDNERRWLKKRLQDDHGDETVEQPIGFRDVVEVLKDYKIILGALIYFSFLVPSYCYAYFSPTIIKSYGYSTLQTQLHSVPPLAMAFFLSIGIAFASDKLRHRYLFIVFTLLVAITGIGILLTVHDKPHVEYAALFLVVFGPYCGMPVALCWFTMNVGGHRRRAVGTALQLGFGEIAGIVSTFLFQANDAPYYHTGYSVAISFFTLAVFWCTCYFFACWSQNRSRDRLMAGSAPLPEKGEGDLAVEYRYML